MTDTATTVVHSAGDAPTDWALVVRADGEVLEARRRVPYDGVLRFSTAARPNSRRKNSQFRLTVAEVVDTYRERADVDLPRGLLLARARQALAVDAVQEVTDGDH
jgi:hypothetical protein